MTISVGIIGFGTIGQRIYQALSKHSSFHVSCVYDSDLEKLKALDSGTDALSSPDEMFTRSDVDLVYVGTPPASHIDYCYKAIEAKKAIWVEKPLAVDIEAAEKLVEDVEKSGLPAVVNLPGAASPSLDTLKLLLSDIPQEEIENVEMQIHFSQWPRKWQENASSWLSLKEQGGFLREVVTHFFFMHQRLLGSMTLENAEVNYPDDRSSETFVNADYLSGNIPVRLEASSDVVAEDYLEWKLTGKHKSIRELNWRMIEVKEGDTWKEVTVNGEHQYLSELIKLMAGEKNKLATLREALEVQKMIERTLAEGDT
ncbi:Gfo/Idh/MocA family protein [Veronia nyctiphanis]|uniref:Gfo/Idh/MocA family protein n=1 Tax=Veronia nyctiphanis TaxID=1278244 RepID=UPI00137583AA|nr:Gfo/Idh/MocA family oxidoreductase [Veronia nyctiphanis]